MSKSKMVSIRFSAEEVDAVRGATEGRTLSQFIRSAVFRAIPAPTLEVDSWFVPYGFGGSNGPHHRCRACGVTSSGSSNPLFTGHFGGCSELAKVISYFRLADTMEGPDNG